MSSTYTFGNINYSYTPPAAGITTSTASVSGITSALLQSYNILSSFVVNSVTYTVNNIASSAFHGASFATQITIPNSITNIGNGAFAFCTSLINITLPTSITNIGNGGFQSCISLTNITLPTSITNINNNTFLGCIGLKNITLPNSINDIGNVVFFGCSGLTNIILPNNITSIKTGVFNYCSSLTNISIPNTVTFIGDYAFANCTSLNNLTIPPSVTTFYKNNFVGLPTPYNVFISNSSNINLLDQSSNVIWYNINIKLVSSNLTILNGYFSTNINSRYINIFYNSTNLTQNILAITGNDNNADYMFNIGSNNFTPYGTTINSIPALDAQYNASEWSITNSSNVLFYKDSTTGVWSNLPVGTVSITNTRLYTNPIPSIDLPIISPICFPAGTPVLTDQGIFAIETIDINCNTINGNKIKAITKTISLEPELVLIKQNAININVPDKDTITTMNHEILYNNIMTKAKDLVGFVEGVSTVKNTNEYLYNILLNKHSIMIVNNMIVETLHPDNVIATIYNNSTNEDERNKLKLLLNNAILTKDFNKYDEFFKLLKIC